MTKKAPPKPSVEKTRSRILKLLKREGPQEASALAQQINVTDMAIRQHLYALEEIGDICFCPVPRPKGRPAKLWQLTEQANRHFPNGHADFSMGLITSIQQIFGDTGMEKLLDVRLKEQSAEYGRHIPSVLSLKERLEKLVEIRSREGYMADILPPEGDEDYLFVENNCPVCVAAKTCSGICNRELDLFKIILGEDVIIKRSEHIIKGARRCAYEITEVR